MPNAWVAVDAGVDPVSWARLLRKAHTRALDPEAGDGTLAPSIVREVVRESWARAASAGVAMDERPPIVVDRDEAGRVLHRHALAGLVPVVETVLVDVARYAEQVVGLVPCGGRREAAGQPTRHPVPAASGPWRAPPPSVRRGGARPGRPEPAVVITSHGVRR